MGLLRYHDPCDIRWGEEEFETDEDVLAFPRGDPRNIQPHWMNVNTDPPPPPPPLAEPPPPPPYPPPLRIHHPQGHFVYQLERDAAADLVPGLRGASCHWHTGRRCQKPLGHAGVCCCGGGGWRHPPYLGRHPYDHAVHTIDGDDNDDDNQDLDASDWWNHDLAETEACACTYKPVALPYTLGYASLIRVVGWLRTHVVYPGLLFTIPHFSAGIGCAGLDLLIYKVMPWLCPFDPDSGLQTTTFSILASSGLLFLLLRKGRCVVCQRFHFASDDLPACRIPYVYVPPRCQLPCRVPTFDPLGMALYNAPANADLIPLLPPGYGTYCHFNTGRVCRLIRGHLGSCTCGRHLPDILDVDHIVVTDDDPDDDKTDDWWLHDLGSSPACCVNSSAVPRATPFLQPVWKLVDSCIRPTTSTVSSTCSVVKLGVTGSLM
jgi:hypothetical protein